MPSADGQSSCSLGSLDDSLATCRPRAAPPPAGRRLATSRRGRSLGYGGARLFARRLRRLEQAAERIASGQFDEPVHDRASRRARPARARIRAHAPRLAQLDHARREFIANASHELRTPLFSLGGFLELLIDEDLDDETRARVPGRMRDQVARLTKLADRAPRSLPPRRGPAPTRPRARRSVTLAGLLVEEFEARAQEGGAPAGAGDRRQAGRALGDEQRVLQIGRVADRERSPSTRRRARAFACASARSGDQVALEVEDDGPGIPAEPRCTSSSASTAETGRGPPGAGSALRSPASWPRRCRARSRSTPEPGQDRFHVVAACGFEHVPRAPIE